MASDRCYRIMSLQWLLNNNFVTENSNKYNCKILCILEPFVYAGFTSYLMATEEVIMLCTMSSAIW